MASNLFCNLMTFGVEVVSIQQRHFVCDADRVLSSDFVVYSAYGNQLARDLFLLVKRTMAAK